MKAFTDILDEMLTHAEGKDVKGYCFCTHIDFQKHGVSNWRGYPVYYFKLYQKERIDFLPEPTFNIN